MLVVGIGISAGGLEALLPFVAKLSLDNQMSYVIVQHVSTKQTSLLAELLQRETELVVVNAVDGMLLEANTIYVAPADADIAIENDVLKFRGPISETSPKANIDYFLTNLAKAYQDQAIGIIFSGSGHDGANGIKAIKASGGITIAQDPTTAKFDSMPTAAIEFGRADLVLAPVDMADKLGALAKKQHLLGFEQSPLETEATLKQIIDAVYKVTDLDFANYKFSTISRQVRRRMVVLQIEDIASYSQFIGQHPEELHRLVQNFLVCVTSFFRDEDSFNALKHALKEIIKDKTIGDDIRIWVPGCATGEEVYSIAMLLAEELGADAARYRIQIFGTDINKEAIQIARKGFYSSSGLKGLNEALRTRYFIAQEQGFVVNQQFREWIVFSRQDIIKNPPFIRLDLISCRNLLIYLNQALQERVQKTFHYALLPKGFLFLGQAESLWGLSDVFLEWDRDSKLFVKNNSQLIRPEINAKQRVNYDFTVAASSKGQHSQGYKALGQDTLVDTYAPPSILAFRDGRIVEFYKNCDAFIKIKPGEADFNLFSIIVPELRTELKAFCHHALSCKQTVTSQSFQLQVSGKPCRYRIIVTPLYHPSTHDELLLIAFEEAVCNLATITATPDSRARITELEHELKASWETLQTVTEALENSVSEWQMMNEGAYVVNEELQASNEELETSNEELQSINEELTLVNDELTLKTHELSAAKDDLSNILDSMEKAMLVVDSQLRISRYNESCRNFFNFNGTGQLNLSSVEVLLNCEKLISHTRKVIETGEQLQYKVAKQNRHYELNIYPYFNRSIDAVTGAVLTIRDVTDKCLAEQNIRLSASVFEAANEAIVITDTNNSIVTVNPAFTRITGYEKDEVIGKNPRLLSSGRQTKHFYQTMWKTIEEHGQWQGEIWNQRKNGDVYPEWLSVSTLRDDMGRVTRYVGIFTDISAEFEAQQTIIQQANYDALTGLPNRNLFYNRLQHAMVQAKRMHKLVGVLFIDLDGFKDINDALGHSQGDIVLKELSKHMIKVFRESDTFARFGGDEFTVLISDLESETDVIAIAEKVLESIQVPIIAGTHEISVTASIGISFFPNDGEDVESLLKHADNAMYSAKAESRNTYRFFTSAMHEKAKEQHRIANDIKNAIKYNQFMVYYQPVYDLALQRIVGAEALIRWHHPVKGFISPELFIPIAEKLNLISPIGDFVLDAACRFVAGLNEALDEPLSIAVNFSALQFISGNCADHWLAIIQNSGISLNRMVVEITESLMMSHQDHYIQQLQKLRQQGIQVALDDFGTGFSSLSYLKNLPLDILKIDKSFIRDILVDESDASLVEAVLAIAKNFSLDVIAEGVEEDKQAEFLIDRQCRYAQGYYFSKPITEAEFKSLFSNKMLN
jgi:two-component system, chemotaxis family, CheB/CheR fusion protein